MVKPELNILASGSKGNCVLLGPVALDMGVPWKTVAPYKDQIWFVFISHRHGDHLNPATVGRLALEKPGIAWLCGPEMMVEMLKCGISKDRVYDVSTQSIFTYDEKYADFRSVKLFHDVPCYGLEMQFGLWSNPNYRAFYAVDTARLDHVSAKNYDLYLVEANYREDELRERLAEKLASGQYAYEERVRHTHMEEQATLNWLYDNMGPGSEYVLLHRHEGIDQNANG